MSVTVTGVVFRRRRQLGDFKWMAAQPEYADAVFLISENFLDMLFETDNGGGTAVLRKETWPNTQTPHAVGIPTGWSQETGGFRVLDNTVKDVLHLAAMRVVAHLYENPHVKRIIYSADEKDEKLIGCGIFKETLHPAVIKHISAVIHNLPNLPAVISPQPTASIRHKEYSFVQLAQAFHERDWAMRQLREMKAKKRVAPETPLLLPPQKRPAVVDPTKAAAAKPGAGKGKGGIVGYMRH